MLSISRNLFCLFTVSLLYILSGCSNPPPESSKVLPNKPAHIVILIEENKGYDQIVGNPDAPYINFLAKKGVLFTDAHGVAHPSQPNYIALFSGSTLGVTNDRCLNKETPYSTPNLGHTLIDMGFTFVGYSESMPSEGFNGCGKGESEFHGSPLYARKHNPWVNWQGNTPTGLSENINRAFSQFPTDFTKLPTVAFVIPNEDNDMHNGPDSLSISRADRWLKSHMKSYIQWAQKHNSLFILTWDEDNSTRSNHIPMIFLGPMIKNGQHNTTVNHYNVLRTLEDFYKLSHTASAANKNPIIGIWKLSQRDSSQSLNRRK